MKRSPLTRRTALKRGTKGLKKSRLSPMSKGRKGWMKLYREQCKKDGKLVWQERHHPMGRQGEYLLCYILVSAHAHKWIHDFGSEARRIGWLLAPYEGRPYDPNEKRGWHPYNESHWPEKFRRLAS